jgi:putative Mg2+ transporter-C (MgtC) family protein
MIFSENRSPLFGIMLQPTKDKPMMLDTSDLALRLGAAVAAGMAIGLNRGLQGKPIGMRTLALVALGSAIVTVVTIQVDGMWENPDALSRVVQGLIQGLMTGIGFIGGGVILRKAETDTVHGLTTAATVWVTAALGIACGLAAWRTIAVAIGLTLAVLIVLAWAERLFKLGDD